MGAVAKTETALWISKCRHYQIVRRNPWRQPWECGGEEEEEERIENKLEGAKTVASSPERG